VTRLLPFALLMGLSAPASAQQLEAVYTWDTFVLNELPPQRVRITFAPTTGIFGTSDGSQGEFDLSGGGNMTLWFVDRYSASLPVPYTPIGAGTWEGTLSGGQVCRGTSEDYVDTPGDWKTVGCELGFDASVNNLGGGNKEIEVDIDDFSADHFLPFTDVRVYLGDTAGSTPVDGCNLTVPFGNAVEIAEGTTDDGGAARLTYTVPPYMIGNTMQVVVVDLAACAASDDQTVNL